MKLGLGQGFIDTRLVGAERPAPLQQQHYAIERESCAQVPVLARCARFRNRRSFLARRIGGDMIAQHYRRRAL